MKILYIGGTGRSGSTLLEMILGNLPGFFSVGEIRHYWEYSLKGTVRCGCGDSLNCCGFWSQVYSSLHNDPDFNLSELTSLALEIDRTRNLPLLTQRYPITNSRFSRYLQATYKLYRCIQNITGADILVDTSKVPSHLYLLKFFPDTEIYTLHLVRDPRAVVYSWNKRCKIDTGRLTSGAIMNKRPILTSILRWSIENYYIERYSNNHGSYVLLRYEDFTKNPTLVLNYTLRDIKLGSHRIPGDLDQPLSLLPTHSVGGNPVRFEHNRIGIHLNNEWEKHSPKFMKGLITILVLPQLMKYGYLNYPTQ